MRTIVMILNRARLDAMGLYGSDTAMTPHLDRLAGDSVVFDQHFADLPDVRGARRVWNSGCYTHPGGLRAPMGLADRLWEAQVHSVLIGGERSPTRSTAFAQGWETTQWLRKRQLPAMNQPTMVDGTLQLAIDWLEHFGTVHDNWCLWVEVDALNPPWDPAEYMDWQKAAAEDDEPAAPASQEAEADSADEGDEDNIDAGDDAESAASTAAADETQDDTASLEAAEPLFQWRSGLIRDEAAATIQASLKGWQQAYGGVLSYVDDLIGQFVQLLKELQLYEQVHLIITSDVGLPLGEHGAVGDVTPWLHEELVHLPLIVHLPGNAEAGRRIHHLTQAADLPVTLAEWHQLNWNTSSAHGFSLMSLIRGQTAQTRDYLCSRRRQGNQTEWMIRTHQWHFLLPICPEDTGRSRQLFIKPDDRFEVNNVADQYPQVADHLELTLRRYISSTWCDPLATPPPLDAEMLKIAQ